MIAFGVLREGKRKMETISNTFWADDRNKKRSLNKRNLVFPINDKTLASKKTHLAPFLAEI